ncbi:hypothetical protein [Roseibium sp. MB-4]
MSVTIEQANQPRSFANFEKDQALKILVDYSLATGRKWQAIRSEILSVTETETTDYAPLLTRQDLESWAARKSSLGDAKFKIVFEFLTHPDTLARDEFAKANNLTTLGTVGRIGSAFEEFFSPFHQLLKTEASETDRSTFFTMLKLVEGCWSGKRHEQRWHLVTTHFPNSGFFVCHYFRYNEASWQETGDWNLERYSGILTIGTELRLYVKQVLNEDVQDMRMVLGGSDEDEQAKRIWLVFSSLLATRFNNFLSEEDEEKRFLIMARTHPETGRISMELNEDKITNEFVDNFRWNV